MSIENFLDKRFHYHVTQKKKKKRLCKKDYQKWVKGDLPDMKIVCTKVGKFNFIKRIDKDTISYTHLNENNQWVDVQLTPREFWIATRGDRKSVV